jgi:curli biogenesis system outer membrane secretion channel CsgG
MKMSNFLKIFRKSTLLVMMAALLVGFLFGSPVQAEVKKSIAVAPIKWGGGRVSWVSPEALHAQMITELSKSGRYRVVERENLKGMLKEQDLAASGRMRKGSGAKTGDLEGAQIMIKCVITDAEEKSGKGGGFSIGGFSKGGGETRYRVAMDVRTYDTTTGLILNTTAVSAEQVKKSASTGISVGPFSKRQSQSGGDTTGEITRELIRKALDVIDQQAAKIEWKSRVVNVQGGKAIILGGTRDGLEPGMKFKLLALGEPIKDAKTGEIISEGEETEVGVIQITSVKKKVAFAKKIEGKEPEPGNLVKLMN